MYVLKRLIELGGIGILVVCLSSCSHPELRSPCAHFGAHCPKVPINEGSWS